MNSTVEILKRLIAYPTVSRNSNLELIEFVADYLDSLGARCQLVYNEDNSKANLYATLGPDDLPGVMLSGHSDVVPADGQPWTRDAFKAEICDDRIYGRGSTDMKGYLAAVLAPAPDASRRRLIKPLHIAFSYDEEIGCVGVRGLIDVMQDFEIKPEFCVIGEPTEMQTAIAHKGKTAATCHCKGVAAHSALAPSGLNAIYLAQDMIQEIRQLQEKIIATSVKDQDFDVPYTTLHVGTIQGGTVVNIVPDHCEFKFEVRNLADDDPMNIIGQLNDAANEITQRYRSQFEDSGIEIAITNQYPALNTQPNAAVVNKVNQLLGNDDTGKLAFGTEGGLFQNLLNIPTVICGPGSMDQGHKADEFVALSQLNQCDKFLSSLLDDISG